MVGHTPVLLKEALEFLGVKPGGKYIDATFGGGGHAKGIAERGGQVLGIDWDPNVISNFKCQMSNVQLVNGNFRDIEKVAHENNFYPVNGVLFDLGISSIQLAPIKSGLEESSRGFSFQGDAPLDMRINRDELGVTAADLVNGLREDQLYELFSRTSEPRVAKAVARAVVRERATKRIEKTSELVNLVNQVYRGRERKISPATTIFLALRMAVNSEIENLQEGLAGAFEILDKGGRLVVISFHSGEDRVVKEFIRVKSAEERMMSLTKNPITPTGKEILENPRARSAKLRVGEKC